METERMLVIMVIMLLMVALLIGIYVWFLRYRRAALRRFREGRERARREGLEVPDEVAKRLEEGAQGGRSDDDK